MDLVKSTMGSVTCLRGFALAMIVDSIKNCVIDLECSRLDPQAATSSATIRLELSMSKKYDELWRLGDHQSQSACQLQSHQVWPVLPHLASPQCMNPIVESVAAVEGTQPPLHC